MSHCSGGEKLGEAIILTPRSELNYPIENIEFRQSVSGTETPALHIIAGGDVMLGHWTKSYIEKYGSDYPFRGISTALQNHDVVIANLEAPFADYGENRVEKQYTFKVPTDYAWGLKKAGFNVVSLANNHILDFGFEALQQTIQTLDKVQIYHSGAGMTMEDAWNPAFMQTKVGRVAFLAFSMTFPKEFWANDSVGGTAYPLENKLKNTLQCLKDEADVVILSFHWGQEKSHEPKDYQRYYAHFAIDHGADLIIGHHPHVLQGVEIYKGKLIAYSLGNLAFSSYSQTAVNSALLRVVLTPGGRLLFGRIIPLNVDNSEVEFQPRVADEPRRQRIFAQLDTLSYKLTGRDIVSDTGLIFDFLNQDSTSIREIIY